MFTPFGIVGVWFRGLLAIVILCAAGWLIYEWYDQLPKERIIRVDDQPTAIVETMPLGAFERMKFWSPALDWTTFALASGAALVLISLFGRTLASPRLFLKKGNDGLNHSRTGKAVRVTSSDGTTLQVELYGDEDAPPIVLTHGWSNDSAVWFYVKKHLSQKYRLIVWDLPGHGLSHQAANNDYSVERFANDLKAVLDLAGQKPVVLLGHSLGGMTVQMFAKLFPEELSARVSRIILLATTYTNPLKTTKWAKLKLALQKPLVEPLLHLTIWLWPIVWLMNWLSYLNGSAHRSTARSSFDGTETREQLDFSARYTAKAHPAVMARGMLGMLSYDVTDVLPKINVPTLLIDCAHDEVILPRALEYISTQLPIHSSASLIPARHMGNLERNQEFSQLIDIYANPSETDDMNRKQIKTSPNKFSIVSEGDSQS